MGVFDNLWDKVLEVIKRGCNVSITLFTGGGNEYTSMKQ